MPGAIGFGEQIGRAQTVHDCGLPGLAADGDPQGDIRRSAHRGPHQPGPGTAKRRISISVLESELSYLDAIFAVPAPGSSQTPAVVRT